MHDFLDDSAAFSRLQLGSIIPHFEGRITRGKKRSAYRFICSLAEKLGKPARYFRPTP